VEVSKPRLLDLFCCEGGAATGYHAAGFDVTGIDLSPQPRYPFSFIQCDALEYVAAHGHEYDAIHASPPCQRYSATLRTKGDRNIHPDLIAPTRAALKGVGRPWVMENVEGAKREMIHPALLCGSMFGLHVRRHRLFESSFVLLVPDCVHDVELQRPQVYQSTTQRDGTKPLRGIVNAHATGARWNSDALAKAMAVEWMSPHGAREAIPPVYTEFIGHQLLAQVVRTLAA